MQNTVKEFFDMWPIYECVLEHNYMFHNEIYEDVQRCLAERYAGHPYKILDLGCGSARHLANALKSSSVACYHGYDLSDTAIAHARRNLAYLDCPVTFSQGDLLDGLQNSLDQFDVVFSSFALHHLDSAKKDIFFEQAYRVLNEQGFLLLIDVGREGDETRPEYLDRYCGWLKTHWHALSPEAMEAACGHIRNDDFPDNAAELCARANQAGFMTHERINQFRWHHIWRFDKMPRMAS